MFSGDIEKSITVDVKYPIHIREDCDGLYKFTLLRSISSLVRIRRTRRTEWKISSFQAYKIFLDRQDMAAGSDLREPIQSTDFRSLHHRFEPSQGVSRRPAMQTGLHASLCTVISNER